MNSIRQPTILWSFGTAYDLFASLHVLHHPTRFGLRGSWAAGVRSRLTSSQRAVLEQAQDLFFSNPLAWTATLPEPRDAAVVLWALGQIAPAERLPTLAYHADQPSDRMETLKEVAVKKAWSEADMERLRSTYERKDSLPSSSRLVTMLERWSHSEEFGEEYLAALQAYVSVFFAEEERRIKPYLEQSLAKAQDMAKQLDFSQLMLELSQGVKVSAFEQAEEIIFAPSYWITPLVMYDCIFEKRWMIVFGARPADESLVPGDVVPDAMLRALKALSDPTRMLVLRYLRDKPQTPSQLASKLRLRPPTVIHHLSALRLAGLVYVAMEPDGEKRYTVRESAVTDSFEALMKFLSLRLGR